MRCGIDGISGPEGRYLRAAKVFGAQMTRIRPSIPVALALAFALAASSMLLSAAAGPRGCQVGRQGPRLRPRGRDEPVRRLRLRPPRQGLPLHPPPLLPGDLGRTSCAAPASCGCWSTSTAATSASPPPAAPAGGASTPTATTRPTAAGNGVRLRTSGGKLLERCGGKLRAAGRGRIRIAGVGAYRGALEVVPTDSGAGSLNAINAVSVDQYVKGVVAERDAGLLADGGAAGPGGRQPLLRPLGRGGRQRLRPLRRHQQPGLRRASPARPGAATGPPRAPATRSSATAGAIAEAFFSACSGGHTESVENVFFGNPVPYLKSVRDPYDYYCPLHTWKLRFSGPEISSRLGAYLDGPPEADRRHQARRLAADRLGAPLRDPRRQQDPRRLSSQYALGGYDRWMNFRKVVSGR